MPSQSEQARASAIYYRTVEVAGIEIFYREAGNPKSPTILLLHGFPMFSSTAGGVENLRRFWANMIQRPERR